MRRDSVRRAFGTDQWPLYLMSAAQKDTDALVGGVWEAFFEALTEDDAGTMEAFFRRVQAKYYRNNRFELLNRIKSQCYVPEVCLMGHGTAAVRGFLWH